MKIALCGRFNTDIKHQGGSAEVLLALAEKLSKNNNVTLFGRGKPTKDIVDMCQRNGITFFYIPSDTYINILLGPMRSWLLLRKKINDFDIIHTHNGSYAFASLFFKKKSKIVTHIHEIARLKDNPIKANAYLLLESFLIKLAAKRSDLSITHSEYMKTIVMNEWHINHVVSIKIGIDTNIFKYERRDTDNEIFEEGSIKLVYVGRLTKRKGIIELIQSLDYLKDKTITLCIVGTGELYSEIKQMVSKKNIKLIEAIKNTELRYLYSAAELVVVPSHYEPTGLVPLEALSCGTPVLVSNNTGLKEIEPAFFINEIEPKSIAKSILETLQAKKLTRDHYRKYILENHNWDILVNQYEYQYAKL